MQYFPQTAVFGAIVLFSTSAPAAIEIKEAEIKAGNLVISGLTAKPKEEVTIDSQPPVRSDINRRFRFSKPYVPSTCMVMVKAGNDKIQAAVKGCGPQGPPGPANTLSIGTVISGPVAAATITGNPPSQILNLILPKGDPGMKGDPGKPTSVRLVTDKDRCEPNEIVTGVACVGGLGQAQYNAANGIWICLGATPETSASLTLFCAK